MSVSDDTSIQMNASATRKAHSRGKNYFQVAGSSIPSRFCTFCNRTNYTVDFCYQKHGYPNINKKQSRTNVLS